MTITGKIPGKFYDAGGAVFNVMHPDFGATGDGTTDDTAAVALAFAAAKTAGGNVLFPAGKNFVISGLSVTVGDNSSVFAHGATITCPDDAVCIDLNANADSTDVNATIVRMFRWYGGYFVCTASSPSVATGLRALDFRHFRVADARFEGWYKGCEIASSDTYKFSDLFFYDNDFGIYLPDWSDEAGPSAKIISVLLDNVHMSFVGKTAGVRVLTAGFDFHMIGGSFNGDAHGAWFSNDDGQFIGISFQGVHFEQGTNATNNIWLEDSASANAYLNFQAEDCYFQAGGAQAVVLERVNNATFSNNKFSQTTAASGLPITLDALCSDINIQRGNFWSTAVTSYACDRSEITFGPEVRRVHAVAVTGFNGDSFSSGSGTIDMSSAISTVYPSEGPPTGYWINMQIRDSGSAAGVARIKLLRTGTTATNVSLLTLDGVGNDVIIGGSTFVTADANGDIDYTFVATGASTLDVWLAVAGIAM